MDLFGNPEPLKPVEIPKKTKRATEPKKEKSDGSRIQKAISRTETQTPQAPPELSEQEPPRLPEHVRVEPPRGDPPKQSRVSEEDERCLRLPPTVRFGTLPARPTLVGNGKAPVVQGSSGAPDLPKPQDETVQTGGSGHSPEVVGGGAESLPVNFFTRPCDLNTDLPDKVLAQRKPGTPIVRGIEKDLIEEQQIYDEKKYRPKKVGVCERTHKEALVAWTAKTGWIVYVQNNTVGERAFWFYEAIDDPTLSYREMKGLDA